MMRLFFLLAAFSFPVYADTEYQFNVGLVESDNIQRTSVNEQSGEIGTLGLSLNADKETRKVDLDAVGDLSWLNYFQGDLPSEVVGNFSGHLRFKATPYLAFVVDDEFGQGRIDPTLASNVFNRENINYFTAGPDFTIGGRNRLVLSGRFSSVTYEETPLDSERFFGSASVVHDFSQMSRVSANASRTRVEYDAFEFERDSAFVRFEADGRRTHLGVDLGQGRSDLGDTLIARLDVSRNISSSATLRLNVGREFSDSGSEFLRVPDSIAPTAQQFTSEYATLGLDFRKHRTDLGFSVGRYDEIELDRRRITGEARVIREITPKMTARLVGSYSAYEISSGDVKDAVLTAGLSRRFGRRVSATIQLQRYSGESVSKYVENRAWIGISYGSAAPHKNNL